MVRTFYTSFIKTFPIPKLGKYSSIFHSYSAYLSKLNLVYGMRQELSFSFWDGYPVVPALFIEQFFFSPLIFNAPHARCFLWPMAPIDFPFLLSLSSQKLET